MGLQFAVYSAPGGTLLDDYSNRVQQPLLTTNNRGFAEASGFVPMGIEEAFRLYDRPGLPHVVFADSAAGVVYEGRLEDVNITPLGVELRAFGYSRSLGDAPYTAFWSTTDYRLFRPVTQIETAGRTPDRYNIDLNGRIYISTKKGATYANNLDTGGVVIQIPHGSSKKIVGFSLDYTVNLPTAGGANTWIFRYICWDEGFATPLEATTITGTNGTTFSRTVNYVVTACEYLEFNIYNGTGAPSSPAGEDGANFLQILNLRVVSSTANRVNTTLGSNPGSGGLQTVTPPNMANIYVGQQLQIKQGSSTSASVVVTAVTPTSFSAVFPTTYISTDSVNAHVVYADEIVKEIRAGISTFNPTQLAASDALIQSPRVDLIGELYQDRSIPDVLDYLMRLGDNQSTPRQWEWGVAANRMLYFRPQGSGARTWYIDVSELEVQRSIDSLFNSVYGTYRDAFGRTLRTTVTSDAASIARYGLTRRLQIDVSSSTSVTQANTQQAAALADNKDPKPRSGATIRNVYDGNGSAWPLTEVRSGDTMIIRNLPPTLSTAIDRIRVFRITRTEYHAEDDTLTIEPESPLPSLDALLAQALTPGQGFRGRPFIQPR